LVSDMIHINAISSFECVSSSLTSPAHRSITKNVSV
jgi:hypothetical protein